MKHTELELFDITGKIGQMDSDCEWPMYSFDRAAYNVWQAAADELQRQGWTVEEIRVLLQSKLPRWDMDCGVLCNELERAGKKFAQAMLKEHADVRKWLKEGA
jgi:hypothetical protein